MTRTLRRTALVPVLALVALTAACSDDGGDTPQPSPSSAAPTSAAPTSAAPTSAAPTSSPSGPGLGEDAAEALAARIGPAINLRASDLPGFTAERDDEDDDSETPPALLARAASCLGLTADETEDFLGGDDDDDAQVDSPDLTSGEELPSVTYSSSVTVDDDGGVAARDFERKYDVIFSSRGAQCVGELFAASVKGSIGDPTATVRVVSSTLLVVPRQDGQRTGGLDLRLEAAAGGERVSFNFVVAVLFQDDTRVSFLALGGGQLVPSAQREALLTTLSTRLAAEAS